MEKLQQGIIDMMDEDPKLSTLDISKALDKTEAEIIAALPDEMIERISGEMAESLLRQLSGWGNLTTIINFHGSIFEMTSPVPMGKNAHGYYNLLSKTGLHGHLNLSAIKEIFFVSKPFMKRESHYVGFFSENGDCIFKVYLGRSEDGKLISSQVEKFKKAKMEFSQ